MLLLSFSLPSGVVHAQSAPTGLTATGGPGRVTLSWTASDFPIAFPTYESVYNAFYRVYRSTTPGGEETAIAEVDEIDLGDDPPDPPTTYTDTDVTPGTTYYYTVTAVLETISLFGPHNPETGAPVPTIGETGMSNEASATPSPPDPPFDQMSYFTTIRDTDWTYAGYGGIRGIGTGTLTLTGVTGAVTHAYLYWHGPTNTDDPAANAAVTLAGHGITGTNIGRAADNNWGFENSQAYRADVTSLVSGDGTYSLAGFTNDVADINGVSLLVFYDGDPTHYRDVTIFDGNDSNEYPDPYADDALTHDAPAWGRLSGSLSPAGPPLGTRWGAKSVGSNSHFASLGLSSFGLPSGYTIQPWDETFSGVNYFGGDAALYLGVSDGQLDNSGDYLDGEVDINGAMLMPDGNDFNGDTVPNGPSAAATWGGLWDTKGYALASFLHTGANSLHLIADIDVDYLSLVYAVIDQPSAGAAQGPLRPMNLTAVAGDAQVTLSWSPVSGVTYTLARALGPAGPFQTVAAGLTETAYVDTGLTDGTTYYYVVTATDSFGTSASSNVASATPRPAPDFALSPAAGSLTLAEGASGTATLAVSPVNGFTGGVSLDVGDDSGILGEPGDPASIAATLDPADVTLGGTAAAPTALTLTVGAQVPPGTYPLQVIGYDDATGEIVHSATVTVTVVAPAPDFRLAADNTNPTVAQGASGPSPAVTVTVLPANGFQGDVALSLTGLPSGVTAVLNPDTVSLTGGNPASSALTFQADAATPAGEYDLTLTGTSGALTHPMNLRLFISSGWLVAVTDLAAYATRSGRVTLYWSGVPGATGYNVYRGTAAGGEDYAHPVNGSTPVTTLDGGPGVSNLFMYTDTGLTDGMEYFYTVEVVSGAGQSGPSNEDSDAPTPTAIPWDTGNPAAIVSAVEQSDSNQPGLPYSLGYCSPRVMGPDGVIYQNGISNALPPDGNVDPVGRTMTLNGQITDASLFLLEASANTASSAAATSSAASTPLAYGGIRRVTSTPYPGPSTGPSADTLPFDGVSGTYYLPTTADSDNFFLNPNYPPYNKLIDSPNLYVGLTTDKGPEVDAGIYFSPPTTLGDGTQLPNRWHAFMRVADGKYNYYNNPAPYPGMLRAMGDVYNYIYADSVIGNDASLSFSVNLQDHVANLVVFGTDYGGLYYAKWYVAVLHSFKLGGPLNGLRMKRQVSLDQTKPGNATPTLFSNAVAPHNPNGDKVTTAGYFSTGSYMLNITWQGGTLYQGQNPFDWTQNYWDTTLHRTYMSMAGNTPDVVTVSRTVGSSDPADETINIHH